MKNRPGCADSFILTPVWNGNVLPVAACTTLPNSPHLEPVLTRRKDKGCGTSQGNERASAFLVP